MKILGVGIDIIQNKRVKKLVKNKIFIKRIHNVPPRTPVYSYQLIRNKSSEKQLPRVNQGQERSQFK